MLSRKADFMGEPPGAFVDLTTGSHSTENACGWFVETNRCLVSANSAVDNAVSFTTPTSNISPPFTAGRTEKELPQSEPSLSLKQRRR